MIKFTTNGSTVTAVPSKSILTIVPTILTTSVDSRRLIFRGIPLPGSVDEGVFQARLFDSDGVKIGEHIDGTPNSGISSTVHLSSVNDELEIVRVFDAQVVPGVGGSGNNGAGAPSCMFGGISFYLNVGTVGGVPDLLPASWYNLRLEIKVSGHVNRRFVNRMVDTAVVSTVTYSTDVDGGGLVTFNIPITVTSVSA